MSKQDASSGKSQVKIKKGTGKKASARRNTALDLRTPSGKQLPY